MSPYRTAPPMPQKAPRASWWRRIWRSDVTDRLDLRRRRHAILAEYPNALWQERRDLAWLEHLVARRGYDLAGRVFAESDAKCLRQKLAERERLVKFGWRAAT